MTPKLKRTIIAWLLLSPLLVVTIFPFAVMFLTAQVIAWYKTVDRMPVLAPAVASRQSSDGVAE